jgi:peptide/nickel transport system ATP-binding protein
LKESVPKPTPKDKTSWAQRIGLSTEEVKDYNQEGCKFAARCPKAQDICKRQAPGDNEADGRTVKCWLYKQ